MIVSEARKGDLIRIDSTEDVKVSSWHEGELVMVIDCALRPFSIDRPLETRTWQITVLYSTGTVDALYPRDALNYPAWTLVSRLSSDGQE